MPSFKISARQRRRFSMGTRGKIAYRYKGKYYVAYKHYDMYHEGGGVDIVKEIQSFRNVAILVELWKRMIEIVFILPLEENLKRSAEEQRKAEEERKRNVKEPAKKPAKEDFYRGGGVQVAPHGYQPPGDEAPLWEETKLSWKFKFHLWKLPRGPYKTSWKSEGVFEVMGRPPKCTWEVEYIYIVDLDEERFYASNHQSLRFTHWPLGSIPADWIEQTYVEIAYDRNLKNVAYGPAPETFYTQLLDTIVNAGYTAEKELSRGEIASVYLVKQKASEEEMVAKIFYDPCVGFRYNLWDECQWQCTRNSLAVAKALLEQPHPHLVETKEIATWGGCTVLLMPKYDGNLLELYFKYWPDLFDAPAQIAAGISHLHRKLGCVHYDIKPHNILYRYDENDDVTFALCDFEGAVKIPKDEYGIEEVKGRRVRRLKYTESLMPNDYEDMNVYEIDYHTLLNSTKILNHMDLQKLGEQLAPVLTDASLSGEERSERARAIGAGLLEEMFKLAKTEAEEEGKKKAEANNAKAGKKRSLEEFLRNTIGWNG